MKVLIARTPFDGRIEQGLHHPHLRDYTIVYAREQLATLPAVEFVTETADAHSNPAYWEIYRELEKRRTK